MSAYTDILEKLEHFTKKYYTKQLLKGILLFISYAGLLFIGVLSFEYFLWMNSLGRLILLLILVVAGLFLLYKYIFTPILYLFRLKRGMSKREASMLIGKHFPFVADRLYNLLDLADDKNHSELLLASIEQRSKALHNVPFVNAISFKDNVKYIKYLTIPILLFLGYWLSGNLNELFTSYNRVVNYNLAYEPPAPFKFELLNTELKVLNDKSYTITMTTSGDVRPDAVNVVIDGNTYLLKENNNVYTYTLAPPIENTNFYFISGKVRSSDYSLVALKTPLIKDFQLKLEYPSYTTKLNETIKSTGNVKIPEGTEITWTLEGSDIENISFKTADSTLEFDENNDKYNFSKIVKNNLEYRITTSNENVNNHEVLDFNIGVIKDALPTIAVNSFQDSTDTNVHYFSGEASDDYGVSKITLVYYPDKEINQKQEIKLFSGSKDFIPFYYTFPSGLNLVDDVVYSIYFECYDNDGVNGSKRTKSQVFTLTSLGKDAKLDLDLKKQNNLIKETESNLDLFNKQKEVLKELETIQRQKDELNFNEHNRIQEFLNKQMQQESLMEKFSKEMKDNIEKSSIDIERNELLKERLERQEKNAKRNENLLKELAKVADKINKEELSKKLDELGKRQKNNERNLSQLLELTKRYYVREKVAQLGNELEKLSKRQDSLADKRIGEKISKAQQEKLISDFNKISEDLDELTKDNEGLKKPIKFSLDEDKKEEIRTDQIDALEELNKIDEKLEDVKSEENEKDSDFGKQTDGSSKKQKSAARKMQEMSDELNKSAMSGGGSGIVEDAEMLRQILDNLVVFSLRQENLFDASEDIDLSLYGNSRIVKEQNELKSLFEHVDDSLFALSLRRVELSEFVNEQIIEVYYNIDKSLESFSENQKFQGISYQKYVVNAGNSLADFLANILDNMQESISSGSGEGGSQGGFQLPDIIKAQSAIKEKMDSSGGSPKGGQESMGEGKNGQKGENGDDDQEGEKGSNQGKEGKGGSKNKGSNGSSGKGNKGNDGFSDEEDLQEVYEIYKEQQLLRKKLESQLNELINNEDRKLGEKLLRQMEDFENDLLENGITERTRNKINVIEHELLKLKDATLKRGNSSERKSNTNVDNFSNPILTKPDVLDDYNRGVEILNRQTLPLRQNFRNKVKEYFKSND